MSPVHCACIYYVNSVFLIKLYLYAPVPLHLHLSPFPTSPSFTSLSHLSSSHTIQNQVKQPQVKPSIIYPKARHLLLVNAVFHRHLLYSPSPSSILRLRPPPIDSHLVPSVSNKLSRCVTVSLSVSPCATASTTSMPLTGVPRITSLAT